MTSRPVYFGSPGQPLFGWLHEPADGRVGAGAVLCPSLGLEGLAAHQTFRHLAERLSGLGVAALRFDYEGTGDSAGPSGRPRVAAWSESIGEAARALRGAGVPRVILVGMRAGALLAATAAAAHVEVAAVALWDPPVSGRAFLREQRALRLLAIGPAAEGGDGLEGPGIVFDPATAEDLARLHLDVTAGGRPAHLLVLGRSDHRDSAALRALADAVRAPFVEAVGQAELLDVLPDAALVPGQTVRRIADWCASLAGDRTGAFSFETAQEAAITLADGRRVIERPLSLGERLLFAVAAEPDGMSPTATVLLANAGVLHHAGPARVWVDLARELAAAGMRVVRMDQAGIGDSPALPGRPEQVVYSRDALDDFRSAIEALEPDAPENVVLVGLCSGAYHGIEVGRLLHSKLVCAVNPILTFAPDEVANGGPADPRRRAAQPLRWPFSVLRRSARIVALGERLPPAAWWLLDRLGLQPSPGRGLADLVEGGTELLLICGEGDARPFLRRARWLMRRLQKTGRLRFEVIEGLDHTLLAKAGREAATRLLADCLRERFAAPWETAAAGARAASVGTGGADPTAAADGTSHEP